MTEPCFSVTLYLKPASSPMPAIPEDAPCVQPWNQLPVDGTYLTRTELAKRLAPTPSATQMVEAWLQDHAMAICRPTWGLPHCLYAESTATALERALGVIFPPQGASSSASVTRIEPPATLATAVTAIEIAPGPQAFAVVQQCRQLTVPGTSQASTVADNHDSTPQPAADPPPVMGATPAQLHAHYTMPAQWQGQGETIALMMLGGTVNSADLYTFWAAHAIPAPAVHLVQVGRTGAKQVPSLYHREATMTVAWAGAMAPEATIVVYQIDPAQSVDPWATFLRAILHDHHFAPTVACISWTCPESVYYAKNGHTTISALLDQCALVGITVVSATGNWGTLGGVPRLQSTETVEALSQSLGAQWQPQATFPAVEPGVLAVGGTVIHSDGAQAVERGWHGPPPPHTPELQALHRLGSTGGFSQLIPIPGWQQPFLRDSYVLGDDTHNGTHAVVVPQGRGIPDVALMASGPASVQGTGPTTMVGYQLVLHGQWIDYAGGTSIAAPIWAAIIGRANQARRAAGQPRLGAVGPQLYHRHLCTAGVENSTSASLHAITAGTNTIALALRNTGGEVITVNVPGYRCTHGWSPVTGLGVPHVANLIADLCRQDNYQLRMAN